VGATVVCRLTEGEGRSVARASRDGGGGWRQRQQCDDRDGAQAAEGYQRRDGGGTKRRGVLVERLKG
jgi:hypothetical protein